MLSALQADLAARGHTLSVGTSKSSMHGVV